MDCSNAGKLVPFTGSGSGSGSSSRSPIPQLVKLIEHLVIHGKLEEVQNILITIEKKMRTGNLKRDPEDLFQFEEMLKKTETECNDLKEKNKVLAMEKDKVICGLTDELVELKGKLLEKNSVADLYRSKIMDFDKRVTQLNMELHNLWEKGSAAEQTIEEMRRQLAESHQIEEGLRRKLVDSSHVIGEVTRKNHESNMTMERMKRKMPEPDAEAEGLKIKNMEASHTIRKLMREKAEALAALERLSRQKVDTDRLLKEHRRWFAALAPMIKNVGEELGKFLSEASDTRINLVSMQKKPVAVTTVISGDKPASGSGGGGLFRRFPDNVHGAGTSYTGNYAGHSNG